MKNNGVLSPVLIKENIKRNAYVMVIGIVLYFMSCSMIAIMSGGGVATQVVKASLRFENPGFFMIELLLPLVASVLSMGYMHKKVQAMNTAAMPFSRKKIFMSKLVSGWAICLIPVIANALLIAIVCTTGVAQGFIAKDILIWLGDEICIVTYFYGLFTLAGSLTGTTVKHVLLSGVFYGIVPVIILCCTGYASCFLNGYAQAPEWVGKLIGATNPQYNILSELFIGYTDRILPLICYLAAGLVFMAIALMLYQRVKLEKIGKSVLFRNFEDLLAWMVTFVGGSCMGFILYAIIENEAGFLAGLLIGGLLTFVVIKIIIEKTVRIVSKRNLISLAVIAAMIFGVCAVTMLDVTGYQKRVPEVDNVKCVKVAGEDFNGDYNYFYDLVLSEEDAIEYVTALHDYAAKNEGAEEFLRVEYTLKNGGTMLRSLSYDDSEYARNLVKSIKNTDDYKKNAMVSTHVDSNDVSMVDVSVNVFKPTGVDKGDCSYYEAISITDKKIIKKLIETCDKSVEKRYSTDETDGVKLFENSDIHISFMQKAGNADEVYEEAYSEPYMDEAMKSVFEYYVHKNDTEVINYISQLFEEQGKRPFVGLLE